MIIQCEQCRTKFKLDDNKVTERGAKVRCAKCRHVFTVRKPGAAAPEELSLPAVEAASGAAIAAAAPNNTQPETIRVEIIAGKTMQVDCNTHFLTGTLKEEVLQGWGYTYYQFHTTGNAASTRMACPPNDKPRTAFVAAPSITVPYNAKLPLVIYTPKGYHVQYRLWQATPALLPAANE